MPERISKIANTKPKVLICPLDWGLGHATRCIPVIRLLLSKGCVVVVAAGGPQKKLLQQEFAEISFLDLDGYQVHYSKKWLMLGLISQLFKIRKAIRSEHTWLQQAVSENSIDWVISDNRYGCYSGAVPSTFITHQLLVKLPHFFAWAEIIVQKILYSFITRYNTCWVPDLASGDRGLSGKLGHPKSKPAIPTWYTGWHSRFTMPVLIRPVKYKCIIILSGPEPQRTILENLLISQLKETREEIVLVRGLPGEMAKPQLPANISVFNHLPTPVMQEKILESEYLVSRSGYSTLMDAFTLQKKCIFIPTPGQTEQEYLGKMLTENKMALVYAQHRFQLATSLTEASHFNFHFPLNSLNNLLENAIDNFLNAHFSGEQNHKGAN